MKVLAEKVIKTLAIILLSVSLLTGCTATEKISEYVPKEMEEYVTNRIVEEAGIYEKEEYKQYESLVESGELNEAGEYQELDVLEAEARESGTDKQDGSIEVSFANNRYFSVEYYRDSEKTDLIDSPSVMMNPGDSIYASVEVTNPNSDHFELLEFRVLRDGSESHISIDNYKDNGDLVYEIPEDYTGNAISVFPVGKYTARSLMLSVYSVSDSGLQTQLRNVGKWSINGKECGQNPTVGATDSYKIEYEIEADKYFYVDAYPAPFTKDPNKTQKVQFYEMKPTESIDIVSVEVHPYLSLSIKFSDKADIAKNDGAVESIKSGKTWSDQKLMYGDCIEIETKGKVTITEGDYTHVKAEKTQLSDGVARYRLYITKENEDVLARELMESVDVIRDITVRLNSNCKYGYCEYKIDGQRKSQRTLVLKENQEIVLTYTITAEGTYFDGDWIPHFVQDWNISDTSKTVRILVTEDLHDTTINPDDYFKFVEREG